MHDNHTRTVQRLVTAFAPDPRYLALIIGGSVAKGWADPHADLDFLLVATDEEYARRAASLDFSIISGEYCDYPDGYVDGKVIDRSFLEDAAVRGSEPARSAFWQAFIAYSHIPDLDALLARIPVYPEAERDEKIAAFYSQVKLLHWFMGEAEKRDDPYLRQKTAADMVLFGGRLILAHNRVLFPSHKWLLRVVRDAPDKPAEFMDRAHALLAQPTPDTATAFVACLDDFRDWGIAFPQTVVRFMQDVEWTWRTQRPPLQEW